MNVDRNIDSNREAFGTLIAESKSEDILLFCHEMVSKTLRKILLNLSEEQTLALSHDQFSFFVIDNKQMHQYNCNPIF